LSPGPLATPGVFKQPRPAVLRFRLGLRWDDVGTSRTQNDQHRDANPRRRRTARLVRSRAAEMFRGGPRTRVFVGAPPRAVGPGAQGPRGSRPEEQARPPGGRLRASRLSWSPPLVAELPPRPGWKDCWGAAGVCDGGRLQRAQAGSTTGPGTRRHGLHAPGGGQQTCRWGGPRIGPTANTRVGNACETKWGRERTLEQAERR